MFILIIKEKIDEEKNEEEIPKEKELIKEL